MWKLYRLFLKGNTFYEKKCFCVMLNEDDEHRSEKIFNEKLGRCAYCVWIPKTTAMKKQNKTNGCVNGPFIIQFPTFSCTVYFLNPICTSFIH